MGASAVAQGRGGAAVTVKAMQEAPELQAWCERGSLAATAWRWAQTSCGSMVGLEPQVMSKRAGSLLPTTWAKGENRSPARPVLGLAFRQSPNASRGEAPECPCSCGKAVECRDSAVLRGEAGCCLPGVLCLFWKSCSSRAGQRPRQGRRGGPGGGRGEPFIPCSQGLCEGALCLLPGAQGLAFLPATLHVPGWVFFVGGVPQTEHSLSTG